MAGILGQAYSPMLGVQGEIQGLLSGSSPARLPERPPIPQVNIKPPNYQALANADQQRAGNSSALGSGIGSLLGMAALIAALPSGGLSLSALPAIGAATAAGGALGGSAGGLIGGQ